MIGIFLDTETNGLNPLKHRVLEVAVCLLNLISGKPLARYEALLAPTKEEWAESDRTSLEINGFTWNEISQGKSKEIVKKELIELFKNFSIERGRAVFMCQNPSFDRAFFGQIIDPDTQEKFLWPYHWLDLASMYWAEAIRKGKENQEAFPWKASLSKDAIAKRYHLPPEKKPHRAMNGTLHLITCYNAVVGFPEKLNSQ